MKNYSVIGHKMIKQSEQSLSRQVVQYLRLSKVMFFHPANESRRTIWEQKQFKDNGGIAGTPDLCLMFNCGRLVFLELKTETGRQSPTQKEFQANAESRGFNYYIARNLDNVIELLKKEKANECRNLLCTSRK
jgi:hypothetical protein